MAELLQESGVWVLLSFVLFVAFSYKKGKEAVFSKLDSKIEKIKTDLETAENLRIEAQELLAQYQRQHREAGKEAASIIESAEKQATLIKKRMEAEFESILENRETWLKQRVNTMEEEAVTEIREQMVTLASKATEELLLIEIDQKTHDKMLESTVKSLSKTLH